MQLYDIDNYFRKNILLLRNLTSTRFNFYGLKGLLKKDGRRSMQRLTIRAKQCALVNAIVN